jgi:murein DD-endopeptidase MepM/ murein hydrolase activator NlpD
MSRVTVIVIPDEASPVRRYRVCRGLVEHGPWAAVVIAVLVAAGSVDYLRLRLEGVEVGRLRRQTARYRSELDTLAGQLASLEKEFDRLSEFERKARVIADLPRALRKAEVPDTGAAGANRGLEEPRPSEPARGQGVSSRPDVAAPGGRGGPESRAAPFPRGASLDLHGEILAGTRQGVRRLAIQAAAQVLSFEDLIGGLEGKRHRLASTPSIWPTEGWVTSRYGYRISPFTGRRVFHAGLDIASDFGTPIVAPARGRVVSAGRKGPLGKTLVIDHGFGLRTSYGHTGEIYVEKGETIERGERIASVGSSGRSTGPHLHYVVEVGGKSVDPRDYIFE